MATKNGEVEMVSNNRPEVVSAPLSGVPAFVSAEMVIDFSEKQPAIGSDQPAKVSPPAGIEGSDKTQSLKPLWRDVLKVNAQNLDVQGDSFELESGERCIRISNAVIERNQKQWENFIIGQFYGDAPSRGAAYAIANGIWSKRLRDISVSRLSDRAFLFKIPSPTTRRRVLSQGVWHFDGETMFVAKWEPGLTPELPELTSFPVWLEFRDVPLQFYNEESLFRIASLVGKPVHCHPETLNLSNLEVAKVYTLIDPRVRLQEHVNVQFESGHVKRISVSSPWLPPICSICDKVGHSIKRCPSAPITCLGCNSKAHSLEVCPRRKKREEVHDPAGRKKVSSIEKESSRKEANRAAADSGVGKPKARDEVISEASQKKPAFDSASHQPVSKDPGKMNLEDNVDALEYESSGEEDMIDEEGLLSICRIDSGSGIGAKAPKIFKFSHGDKQF